MRSATNPFPELENIRAAIVLTSFDLGGAERQALHLASYLQDTCLARIAVVGLFGGLGDQPIRQMCVQRHLPCLRVNMPEHRQGVPSEQSVEQFARDMAFLRPDILLPYTSLPNVLCSLAWRDVGAKICVWNQRDEGREIPAGGPHAAALKNATHIISNSHEGADFLATQRRVPPERIELVFNGVELAPPVSEFDRPPSGFVAAMLANIHKFKDHATLLQAWKIVCHQLPDLNPILLLAGREDDAGATRRLAVSMGVADQVRILGPVADVSSLLQAVDLSVFSSRFEGTPNAVLESMAAGRAVVATDIAGCRNALGENYPALAPPGDAPAMAAHIIALAQDSVKRTETGRSLQNRAATEFSVTKMCQQTCRILVGTGPS
jgi:glycosyltransferase involved in cell wall biosynthesis